MYNKFALALLAVLPLSTACTIAVDDADGDADADADRLGVDGPGHGHTGPIYLHPHGDDHADCTRNRQCATFSRANRLLSADEPNLIVLAPGSYVQSISLRYGATIVGNGAMLLAPGPSVFVVRAGDGQLDIRDLSIYVPSRQPILCGWGGVALTDVRTNAPILCDGLGDNTLALTDVRSSATISVADGDATIVRTQVIGGGGVTIARSPYSITNSLFAQMAAPVTLSGRLAATQSHRFELNTVVDNGRGITGLAAADLQCVDGAASDFKNNIVWTSWQPPFGVIANLGCRSTYSIVWNYASPNVDPMLDEAYHLQPGSPAIDAADPGVARRVDLDGEPVDGPRADIGADEYVP